ARGEMSLVCPDCRESLETLRDGSGRKRGLNPARHPELRLRQVCIFKAPPVPRNQNSYASMVLDALCSEAFQPDVGIFIQTGEEGNDQDAAVMFAMARWMAKGYKVDPDYMYHQTFTDGDGGKGILLTLYEPKVAA